MRTALVLLCGALAWAQPTVIQNANVITVTKGTFKGSVVIENGKIKEVGPNVMVPAGAKVVDAAGQYLMPGIVDAHIHIASDAINEGSISVSSMVGIQDVLNPTDPAIYRALTGGVTVVNVLHGSANPIGGQNAVIKLKWGKSGQELIMPGSWPSLKMALGENPKRQGNPTTPGSTARYPATRMGVEDVIREAFKDAREYKKTWQEWEKTKQGPPPRRDLKLEPLVEVLDGKRLVHVHAYRADEILMILRLADEIGFKVAGLEHVLEGYKVAKEIKEHGAVASALSDWWNYKMEASDAIPYNMALMQKKGVLVAIHSDSTNAAVTRRLNTEAAKAVRYGGVTEDEAMAMITINPAKELRIDGKVGSIEAGKDADLVLWSKHPLSVYAIAQKVWIDGEVYFDREKDIELRPKKEAEKKALLEAEKKTAPAAGPGRRMPR